MLSASQIILEFVCPAAGVITAALMNAAPYRDVRKATREGRLGDLNPTPWAVMLGSCCGWVTYGLVSQDLFVFFGAAPSFCLSVWLNMQAIKLLYGDFRSNEMRKSIVTALESHSSHSTQFFLADKSVEDEKELTCEEKQIHPTVLDYAKIVWDVTAQNTKAPVAHEYVVLFVTVVWVAIVATIGFGSSFSITTKGAIAAVSANVNHIFFYGAPLSTIFTVFKTRSSATIHIPTMILNSLNGIFWGAFGIAVFDIFIIIPNLLGAALGGVQLLLILLFPRTSSEQKRESSEKTFAGTSESTVDAPESLLPLEVIDEELAIPTGDRFRRQVSEISDDEFSDDDSFDC